MKTQKKRMYSLQEAATGYAAAADRLCGQDGYLDKTPEVVPIFVSNLFLSLEISIKYAGIGSGLFSIEEARRAGKGHGIQELADLATERLGGETSDLITAMTCVCDHDTRARTIIDEMIQGQKFEGTRKLHLSRRLGYAEISDGEMQILNPVHEWIDALKQVAEKLPQTISILSQWKKSPSHSKHFAIWFDPGDPNITQELAT